MPIEVSPTDQAVVTVTIANETRRNALDLEMFQQLAALWPRFAEMPSVRVIVLRGAGDTAFCSGADLAAALHLHDGIDDLIDRALLKTQFFPKPIVAAINGHCVAGGLELALSADVRIGRQDAKYGLPEVQWGVMPSGGGTMKLIDQIGFAAAMDLLLTGRLVSGSEATEIGILNAAVGADDVIPIAYERANSIALNSPIAVQAAKRAALFSKTKAYKGQEVLERELVARVRSSGHTDVGIRAFLNGESAVYTDE